MDKPFPKRAMIFAAGLGTRLKPHTLKKAKPALPFLGLPLIAYPIFQLYQLGCREFVINLHHKPDSIKEVIKIIKRHLDIDVLYSLEAPDILLSGGGLKKAESHFSDCESFFVANADNVLFFENHDELQKMFHFHTKQNALATLLTKEDSRVGTQFGGIQIQNQNQVIGFSKTQKPGIELLHFIGFQIYSKKIFQYLSPEPSSLFLDGIVPALKHHESIKSYRCEQSLWLETGTLDDYQSSTFTCQQMFKNENLFITYQEALQTAFHFELTFNEPFILKI